VGFDGLASFWSAGCRLGCSVRNAQTIGRFLIADLEAGRSVLETKHAAPHIPQARSLLDYVAGKCVLAHERAIVGSFSL
jgi:hypothetical protein